MTTPLIDQAETAPPEPTDPDAPYGRNAAGKPYKRSAEERQRLGEQMARGRQNASGARKARTTTGRASGGVRASGRNGTSPHGTYAMAATGLLGIPITLLSVVARFTGNPVFALDALAVKVGTPDLAMAAADLAVEDARIAAVLEHVGKVSPYGALGVAALAVVAQCAANHRLIDPAPEMGILTETELMRAAGMEVPNGHAPGTPHVPSE